MPASPVVTLRRCALTAMVTRPAIAPPLTSAIRAIVPRETSKPGVPGLTSISAPSTSEMTPPTAKAPKLGTNSSAMKSRKAKAMRATPAALTGRVPRA
ncbi:hypothetical protein D3C87_1731600 [compost metagenome]